MIRNEDSLWKGLIEDQFLDFIHFVQPNVDEILDLDKGYDFLDKELEQLSMPENAKSAPRIVDKLVKVFLRNNPEEWALLHFEVQAKHTRDFGKRMHAYFYRLMDKFRDREIISYAIFTETTDKERADTFTKNFMGTMLKFRFNIFKITGQTDQQLLSNENPFAVAIMAARIARQGKHIQDKMKRDLYVKDLKLKLIEHLYSRNLTEEKTRALINFIRFYVVFEFKETLDIFDKQLQILTNNTKTMGLEEQIKEMIKE
ncbi:MAG TPA: hypothetical protein VGC08_14900, partial [Pedobacter sp.]